MYETELYHHGVKGQRWGVRRYQNYDGTLTAKGKKRDLKTAGQYKRALNRIDQGLAEEGHYLRQANKKLARAEAKRDKTFNKIQKYADDHGGAENLSASKSLRLSKKLDAANKKVGMSSHQVSQHKAYIDAGQKLSNQILKEAKSKGYTVTSRKVDRVSNTGEMYAATFLGGWLGTLVVTKTSEGKYYKVKKNPTYTQE